MQEGQIAYPAAWANAMAEHEARLTPGARVRVRLNGECEGRRMWLSDRDFLPHNLRDTEDGRIGVISQINEYFVGHPYHVRLWESGAGHHYAATELEVLETEGE